MRTICFMAAAACAFFAAAAQSPQTSTGGGGQTTIRSESRLVLVDAVVTGKKGAPIRDLTKNDFKILEDGKEQTITNFSFQAEADPSSEESKRHTVLFFDDSSMRPANQHFARDAALKFIETNAGPNRLMSVVNYGGSLRVVRNFTDDADLLKQAVNTAHVAASLRDSQPAAGGGGRRGRGDTSATDFTTRNALSALEEMASNLASVPGRKTLVLFSEGFRARPEEMRGLIDACNRANVAVYPVDIRAIAAGGLTNAAGDPIMDMDASNSSVAGGGNRGRRGGGSGGDLAETEVQNPSASLEGLAKSTGGFVIIRLSELPAGMEKIGQEQSEYYALGYVPAKELQPGACHTIKVKVTRSGANVRSRSAYCDAKLPDVVAGTPTQQQLETQLTSNAAPTVAASMQAPFFYTAANIARVHVAIDIPGSSAKFTKDKGKFVALLSVIGIAYQPDGGVAARFSDNVKAAFDDKKQVDDFALTTYHYEKQFSIAAGQFDLKVAFSWGAGSLGRVDAPLAIAAWDPAKFSVSALALSRSVRRATGSLGTGFDVPAKAQLVVDGVEFAPTASNRFHKAEKAYLHGEIYEPALAQADRKEPPAVALQLILADAKTEKVVKDLGAMRLKTAMQPGNPVMPVGLVLPIADLAPGSYVAQLKVMDSLGNQIVRKIDFEVEP